MWLDSARVSVAIKNAFDDACVQYYEDLETARSRKRGSKEQTTTDKEELDGPAALHRPSPVGIAKAIKNEAELEGMRQAHLRCHSYLLRLSGSGRYFVVLITHVSGNGCSSYGFQD